ncbi:MAG: hypothetical protein FWD38_04750 [Oscillospiraceae bacterium]|nr:hypothetical protein [Oscillospiraceae bacterium]
MRKILENPSYMTIEEIEIEFAGKWVLVTNCVHSEYNQVIGGIPVAIADSPFEGQKDGFYDEFKDPKYSPRMSNNMNYDDVPGFVNFFGTAEMVGENANTYIRTQE